MEFQRPRRRRLELDIPAPDSEDQTPEETIEAEYLALRHELAQELLETVKGQSPAFFERLVVDLLVMMGYGGTRKDAGEAVGQSHDGGIDGIIKEDRLGLDVLYVQAKRWENTVGRPEIQRFAGALAGRRARRGIFITTSRFSQTATDYVSQIDSRIVLIDGDTLAQLMIDYGLGVTQLAIYELKRIDQDYFAEE
jgi:restriction system protein